MHDHSRDLLVLFLGWLHHLSLPSGRKIFGIHRLDRRRLLPDTGFARSACLCDVAPGDFDACPSFSPPMGPAQADRALDDSNLAVRLDHRRARIFDALQMVSSGEVNRQSCLQGCKEYADRIVCSHAQSCARQLFDV